MRTSGVVAAIALVAASAVAASRRARPARDAGVESPDAGLIRQELNVEKLDGGYAVEPADAGLAETQLVPPELLADSPAAYPESLRPAGKGGQVKLELLIDENGEVENATLVEGSEQAFNDSALHAASKLRFRPATLGGEPVSVRINFTYHFEAPVLAPVQPPRPVTGTLQGLVRAKGNRRPIGGATVLFKDDGARVETDAKGRFTAEREPGQWYVRASAPGYVARDFTENIEAGGSVEVIYSLEPLTVNPYETIVHGDKERTEVSRITLQDAELREVPGTMGDPFRVVMLLPGVTSLMSGIAYPVVRGSQPAATGYYIDGIRVPQLFHLFLGPAVIHPDFIDSMDFYAGVAPAEFGRLMGGVINGKISKPREGRLYATGYADFINAGLFAEYPFEQTGTSITLAGRVSYTPWLIAAATNVAIGALGQGAQNQQLVLDFYDYQARVEQKLGGGSLRLFAFGSSDLVGVRAVNERGTTALESVLFHRLDLRYRRELGAGELEAGVTVGLDRLGVDGEFANFGGDGGLPVGRSAASLKVDDRSVKARATWRTRLLPGLDVVLGSDLDRREALLLATITVPNPSGIGSVTAELTQSLASGTFLGGYAQVEWKPTEKLLVVPGLRFDSYHLVPGLNNYAIEPRLTARYRLTDAVTLKGGAGLYHQPPALLINLPVIDLAGLRFGLQEGAQTDLGVEWKLASGVELNVDAYYNPLRRVIEFSAFSREAGPIGEPGSPEFDEYVRRNATTGYATGLEVLLRHPLGGNWFGWLSYSLQRSVRKLEFPRFGSRGEDLGTGNGTVAYAFDQTHVMNAVLSYKFAGSWTAGVTLHFNTGFPEGGVFGNGTQTEGTSPIGGLPRWVPVDRDKWDRLPPFFRVDARVAKSWAFETFSLEAYFDFLNVLFAQEVIGYLYSTEFSPTRSTLKKQPIGIPLFMPILGLKGRY